MIKQALLAATLAVFSLSTHAVAFNQVQADLTAIALSDATPDFQSTSGSTMSLSVSAASVGTDIATAGSVVAAGLMSTSADVSGLGGGVVSAVATSHFLGSFANAGMLDFDIGYSAVSFSSGSGGGGTTLFVTLVSGATTLFSDYVTASRFLSYASAPGMTGSLELTLTSEANAAFTTTAPGGESSFGQVTFTSPVPEPAVGTLLLFGLLATAVGAWSRRHRD